MLAAFNTLFPSHQTVALLRDDFMSLSAHPSQVHSCVDRYFIDISHIELRLLVDGDTFLLENQVPSAPSCGIKVSVN